MNLSQGYSSGGSINNSFNTAQNASQSWSQSGTDAMSARQWSAMMADIAWQRDLEAYQMQMDFNREEAQKMRDWQTEMANTIYTRSVKNMREAGINPILAANMGLSGASVGSGATASIGGAPSAPLAQSFMDSWSASSANGWGMSNGESHGNSWNSSENGLATALTALGSMVSSALGALSSGRQIEISLQGLQDLIDDTYSPWVDDAVQDVKEVGTRIKDTVKNIFNIDSNSESEGYKGTGGGHGFGNKWNYSETKK